MITATMKNINQKNKKMKRILLIVKKKMMMTKRRMIAIKNQLVGEI